MCGKVFYKICLWKKVRCIQYQTATAYTGERAKLVSTDRIKKEINEYKVEVPGFTVLTYWV